MDFITGFPMTLKKHDSILLMMEKLSKEANFIPVHSTHKTSERSKVFMKEIFRLHGLYKEKVLDQDAKFTSNFWKWLFHELGTRLKSSTMYYPQTNGQTKRVN